MCITADDTRTRRWIVLISHWKAHVFMWNACWMFTFRLFHFIIWSMTRILLDYSSFINLLYAHECFIGCVVWKYRKIPLDTGKHRNIPENTFKYNKVFSGQSVFGISLPPIEWCLNGITCRIQLYANILPINKALCTCITFLCCYRNLNIIEECFNCSFISYLSLIISNVTFILTSSSL